MSLRVLFTAAPGVGHVLPMVPLAWALQAGGHEVLVVTGGNGLGARDTGLMFADYTPGMDGAAVNAALAREFPTHFKEVRGSRIRSFTEGIDRVSRLAAVGLDETVRIAETWRPHLVVHDPLNAGGLVVAARLGIPAVQHGFGFARSTGLAELYVEHLSGQFERHHVAGLPEVRVRLDVAPPSMLLGSPEGWSLRPITRNSGGQLPDWLPPGAHRPRVAVTLGTETAVTEGLRPLEPVLDAARGVDADFVLVGADPALLGPLPANVRAVRWLPFAALLEGCAAVVHHGGSGVTMAALAAGLPQLLLPNGADRYANAEAVTNRGAGLTAQASDVDTPMIDTLLESKSLAHAADEVAAEIEDMPTPIAIACRIEGLIA